MRFERVRLEKFKCYADADLRLESGVTVIHGLNGSGKSSLLEACFFALYGAKALDKTLDEVVTIGADDAEVELWFSHGGNQYHIERRVRATGERATTAKCVLETPDATIEGARDVRAYVEDLLRMDHEAFVNCAYVRQGEVNKLINASPDDRQDMLDSLLQLGKLEEYRERANDARVGVKRVRDDRHGALSTLEEQIAEKEDKNLHERLNDLQSERNDVQAEIERIEKQREQAVTTRDEAQAVLDQYEEKRAELDDLESDIAELRETITETEREREEIADDITANRERRESLEDEIGDLLDETDLDAESVDDADPDAVADLLADLAKTDEQLQSDIKDASVEATEHTNTAENHRENAADLEEQAEQKREQAADLEDEIETGREKIADQREKLAELEEEIEGLRGEFDDAPIDFGDASEWRESVASDLAEARERVAQLEADVENQREEIEEAEALLDAGKCPECGQDVEGAPHVESLADDRETLEELESELADAREERDTLEERLDRADEFVEIESSVERKQDNRDNMAQLVDERAATLEEKAEQAERLREEADAHEAEAEEKREAAADEEEEADAARERVAELNQRRQRLKERRERLERLEDLLDDRESVIDALETLRERREQLGETNDERRERLAEKRERRDDLQEEFDESTVEEARTERDRAAEYIEKADGKLEDLRERHDRLGEQIGGVQNELEELENLRERREDLETTVENLESLYEEAQELQEMYGQLRSELRQRNVESLETMLNEIFELIYQNDSYARIELSGDYELTVYQKDGEALDPEQLSGGERAIFNLSLRCAIYRLLAEGIEGAAPMPPLILDEPTVFLDSGHVSRLVELVGAMRDYGVEQILVVSHDDELVGAADDLVRVRKDPTTNRSTVERTGMSDRVLDEVTEANAD